MAIIPANNISGRAVAQVLREKPELRPINGVMMRSYDLWQLCHSANLNVWAKRSPLTCNGAKWQSPQYAAAPLQAVEKWSYVRPSGYEANLSHFADYTDEFIPPVSIGFPQELIQGVNNSYNFNISFMNESQYHISYEDVFAEATYGKLYPCICIDDMAGNVIWVAAAIIPNIDRKAYFTGKTQLRVTYCLSNAVKALDAPNIGGVKFYSIKFSDDTVVSKILPYKAQSSSGLLVNVTSGYVANGSFCTFEKMNDTTLGLYCNITDSNGNTIQEDTLTADITEDGGNTQQVTLARTQGNEYSNSRATFTSAFNLVKGIYLVVYRNGKSEKKAILAKQSPVSRMMYYDR